MSGLQFTIKCWTL